jgi:DNA-directed RNA polymerase subunit H
MHILQPNHTKLKPEEAEKILSELNVSLVQLPKIKISDPALKEKCEISDIIKIERMIDGKKSIYYRVVSV